MMLHLTYVPQERIKLYDKKLKKARARDELARSRPTISLDVAAANRFINAAIPELTQEQKQQLKQVTVAPKECCCYCTRWSHAHFLQQCAC